MKHIAISENHLYSKSYAKGDKFVARHLIVYILKDLKATRLMRANPEKKYINRRTASSCKIYPQRKVSKAFLVAFIIRY